MRRIFLFLFFVFSSIPALGGVSTEPQQNQVGYALIMSNGTKLKVTEYAIDLKYDTITYKSDLSGLTATFPLERIKKVVQYDPRLAEVPDDAHTLYANPDSLANTIDDGGIPILFKVKVVSSGGGGRGSFSRSSSRKSGSFSRGSSGRSSSSSSRSSSRSFGSTSSRSTSRSRSSTSRSRTSSHSRSSSRSKPSAEDFFSRVFGGGR